MRLFVENKHIQNVYTHWRRPGLHDTAELNSLKENNALPRHMNLRHFLIFPLVLRHRRHFLCKSCLTVKTVLILFRWQFPSSVCENVAFDCERPQRHKANGLFPFPFGSEHRSLNTISITFRPLVAWTWNLAPAQWKIALHRHVLHSDVETQSCKMQHSKRARDNRESGGQQKPKTTYCPSGQVKVSVNVT